MDHIPLPIYALTRQPLTIPYVCSQNFAYDNQGFLSYPARLGVDLDELSATTGACSFAVARFVQAWLWFGLLGETLGVGSRRRVSRDVPSHSDFVVALPDGRSILTTAALVNAVLSRREVIALSPQGSWFQQRFDASLLVAARAINSIIQSPDAQSHILRSRSSHDLGQPLMIALSVQVLIETLRSYRSTLFAIESRQCLPRPAELELCPDLLNFMLREAGRPPFAPPSYRVDFQIQYFLSSTLAHDSENTNQNPTGHDRQPLLPSHTTPGCSCDLVQAPESTVSSILQRNLIPLVTFPQHQSGQRIITVHGVGLESSSTANQYIAFSHVRSCGLGNSSHQALPFCRLALLQELANEALPLSSSATPFYIDTLCFPLTKPHKYRAFSSIASIFQHADTVMVLDPSLSSAAVGSAVDALVRIRFSAWKSRLWTLQEGHVAKRLRFLFANRTWDLTALLHEFEPQANISMLARSQELMDMYPRDEQQIHGWLRAFNTDIKSSRERGSLDREAKEKLKVVLRSGYLALAKYRYFREEMESIRSIAVLRTLEERYCLHDQVGAAGSHDVESIERRIERMIGVDIDQDLYRIRKA